MGTVASSTAGEMSEAHLTIPPRPTRSRGNGLHIELTNDGSVKLGNSDGSKPEIGGDEDEDGEIVKLSKEDLGMLDIKPTKFFGVSSVLFLKEYAESLNHRSNVNKELARRAKKYQSYDVPKHWFFQADCNETCLPDCDVHISTDKMMSSTASEEEIRRLKYYRNQVAWKGTQRCEVEYILNFMRYLRQDYYLIKWGGWPEQSATWVKLSDLEFTEKIGEFFEAMVEVLPKNKLPKCRDYRYKIQEEYLPLIKTQYQKDKSENFERIKSVQSFLQQWDPNVLLENEYDLAKFPSAEEFEFIKESVFTGDADQRANYEEQLIAQKAVVDVLGEVCREECGECTKKFHLTNEFAWYKPTFKSFRHYKEDEKDKIWKVAHPPEFMIIECSDQCICMQNGTCKLNQTSKLKNNPRKFMISRTGDERGWGLKCMEPLKKGEAVIEYVGELMTLETFQKKELALEAAGLCYSMSLTQNDPKQPAYIIESSYRGNHSRFINHSCDPNLSTYKVLKNDRNVNRQRPVFFANRNISVGEELTINYQMITEDVMNTSDDQDDEVIEVTGSNERRVFKCKCNTKKCKDRPVVKSPVKKKAKKRKRKISDE